MSDPRSRFQKPKEIIERSLVWFFIGALVMGGGGGVAAYLWIERFVDRRIDARFTSLGPFPDATGAVVAFTGDCPEQLGWFRFVKANSRFIIGAASEKELNEGPADFRNGSNREPLKARIAGQPGGTENVELKTENLPSHGHRISTDRVDDQGIHDGLAGYASPASIDDRGILEEFSDIPDKPGWKTVLPDVLEKTGGGKPHYNMPPYVALYFCEKR